MVGTILICADNDHLKAIVKEFAKTKRGFCAFDSEGGDKPYFIRENTEGENNIRDIRIYEDSFNYKTFMNAITMGNLRFKYVFSDINPFWMNPDKALPMKDWIDKTVLFVGFEELLLDYWLRRVRMFRDRIISFDRNHKMLDPKLLVEYLTFEGFDKINGNK